MHRVSKGSGVRTEATVVVKGLKPLPHDVGFATAVVGKAAMSACTQHAMPHGAFNSLNGVRPLVEIRPRRRDMCILILTACASKIN